MYIRNSALVARLVSFYFITSIGSALSSIAVYLSIDNYFRSLVLLSIALSAKTVASAFASYISKSLIDKFSNLSIILFISQAFGLVSLLVIYFGFKEESYSILLLGVILTGFPGSVISIVMTISFKKISNENKVFRKASGIREIAFNFAMLLSVLLAPVLLYYYSVSFLLLIDAISYFVALLLLFYKSLNLEMKSYNVPESETVKQTGLIKLFFKSKSVQVFFFKINAAMLLVGLLPLLSASNHFDLTSHMPVILRQWLWVIEDIAAMLAGFLYLKYGSRHHRSGFIFILQLNAIFLVFTLVSKDYIIVSLALTLIYFSIYYAFQKFRDDFLVELPKNSPLVNAHAALSQLIRSIAYTVSPLLMGLLAGYLNYIEYVFVILAIQLMLYLLHLFTARSNYVLA